MSHAPLGPENGRRLTRTVTDSERNSKTAPGPQRIVDLLVAMIWPRLSGLLAVAVAAAASAAQHSFTIQQGVNPGDPFTAERYDAGLFTPLGDLSALSTDVYTTLSHPFFPNYNVRIKKSDFCDGTVGCDVVRLFWKPVH